MYLPEAFAVTGVEAQAMLASARLGVMVTHGPSGLFASHLPFLYEAAPGRLIGHLARANPHQGLAPDGSEALVVFQEVDAYVSPSFYPSKAEHGRVVPTWNYEAVHVRGRLCWFSDPGRLEAVLRDLTGRFEAGRSEPWSVDDLPADHLPRQLTAIVGVEVRIEAVLAKRKLSQNRSEADRQGVAAGLSASEDPQDRRLAERMRGL